MSALERLSVLAGHVAPSEPSGESSVVLNTTSGSVEQPPASRAGHLTIVDSRTNRKYEVAVSSGGTIKASDLKQIKAHSGDVGLRTYDPGYTNTSAVKSTISYIDGGKGILRYRGYPIEELADRSTFLEVAYLVVYGELPSTPQMETWREAVMRHSALPADVQKAIDALPHDAHPMGTILTGLCALSTFHPEQNPALAGQNIYDSAEVQDKQIVRLIGKLPALAALAYHRASGRESAPPNQSLDYAENFLYMLDAGRRTDYRPHPKLARALDIMFILHAEHEMNCSTAAARHLASSGVDVYTAMAGAVGALYGPLHGGANEAVLRMLERIGRKENVPSFIRRVKDRKEKLFGFGHRVYKNFDPRAKVIRKVADEVFDIVGRDPLIDVATALMDAARSDPYFIDRQLYPNVDFFSGLVYRAMGFPPSFFTVLFAVPRVTGYLAHWRESLSDPDTKIIRPQQDYQGVWLRHYGDDPTRAEGGQVRTVKASNAYQRRVSGTNWK
ncbi:hypothetical protein BSKO_02133 [Bryopsis sp. KO-2023]|nr:hypothetical protein BSKO_02133 [Bryopsis sp. KO-2023]